MAISPTAGVKVTKASETALKMANQYGLRLTSAYRSPSHDKEVGGSGSGPHTRGTSYDFAGPYAKMELFADWAHKSGLFSQVIFKDRDYRTGRRIPGHQDHVHVGWDGAGAKPVKDERDEPLREGSEGALVMAFQSMLSAMYGDVKADGKFGPKTKAAVIRFQKEFKLKVDGIVGKESWKHLTGVFFSA